MFLTYDPRPNAAALHQGDVLKRTPELDDILRDVHPHYLKSDYRFFMIATQSCDLVRRHGGPCKAPYITIAAVRPLRLAIERFANRLLRHEMERDLQFASDERKEKVRQYVERLLNNNEPGYFFLHSVKGTALSNHHCAFLQLSIALKKEHYDKLLDAKVLQLRETFQHKLGYLLGTTYSRVGTEDWVPGFCDEKTFNRTINDLVSALDIQWLDRKKHRIVLEYFKDWEGDAVTGDDLAEALKVARRSRQQKQEAVLSRIRRIAEQAGLPGRDIDRLAKQLANDTTFMQDITTGS